MESRQKFIEVMGTAAALFDVDLEAKGQIYLDVFWECLKPFSDDEVRSAFTIAMMTLRFMPRPADILEILAGPTSSKASEAWNCLIAAMGHVGAYRSVEFEDKTIHAVVEAWGGWMEVCRITTDELRFKSKEFKELYNSYKNKQVDIPRLIGRIEAENTQTGFLDFIEEPVKVGFDKGRIQIQNKYHAPLQISEGNAECVNDNSQSQSE